MNYFLKSNLAKLFYKEAIQITSSALVLYNLWKCSYEKDDQKGALETLEMF